MGKKEPPLQIRPYMTSKTCCQCSLPVWRGMFCPTCGATATAEVMAETLSDQHKRGLNEIAEVLDQATIQRMWEGNGPITKPLARVILSCLPFTADYMEKAEICRRKLANRLLARHDRKNKRTFQTTEQEEDCPL